MHMVANVTGSLPHTTCDTGMPPEFTALTGYFLVFQYLHLLQTSTAGDHVNENHGALAEEFSGICGSHTDYLWDIVN